jgi:integrase/recombinase XerD
MFEDLFSSPKVLARHRTGPSVDARERFLAHCAGYGAARGTLLRLANELLVVAERIDVDSGKSYLLADVEAAAERWTRYHLVAAGLSLKEIGDHLGHRSAYATRV